MPGLLLSWPLTFNLPVWPPGAVLTHGCLHAPAYTLHLPCARGHLGLLLHMQPVVCTGPPPVGLSLPIVACLLPASAPQSPSPQQKAALRVLWDSIYIPSWPCLQKEGLGFLEAWGMSPVSLVLAMVVSKPADGIGNPRVRCSGREGHSHPPLSLPPNPDRFFYSLPEFTHYPHGFF